MHRQVDSQASMFRDFSSGSRVLATHPLRGIKRDADAVLGSLSREFEELYAATGRPSMPPEWRVKASLLIALYPIRTDRVSCELE